MGTSWTLLPRPALEEGGETQGLLRPDRAGWRPGLPAAGGGACLGRLCGRLPGRGLALPDNLRLEPSPRVVSGPQPARGGERSQLHVGPRIGRVAPRGPTPFIQQAGRGRGGGAGLVLETAEQLAGLLLEQL